MQVQTAVEANHVEIFRDIRHKWRTQLEAGKFYAEGEQVVLRLLASPVWIDVLLTTEEYLRRWENVLAKRSDQSFVVWLATKPWIEAQTGQKWNQPCLAYGRIPAPPVLTDVSNKEINTLVAIDGIDHAVNVGSIVRNCTAFRVDGVIVDESSVHPYAWRAVRASLGGVFSLPVFKTESLAEFLQVLRDVHGFQLIAADPHGKERLSAEKFSSKRCIIFGNEHSGLTERVLSLQPRKVRIPVSGNVDSLNVAAASAVFLYVLNELTSSVQQQSQKDP